MANRGSLDLCCNATVERYAPKTRKALSVGIGVDVCDARQSRRRNELTGDCGVDWAAGKLVARGLKVQDWGSQIDRLGLVDRCIYNNRGI